MKIKTLSACFAGDRESKLPYNITSKEHEKLENILKEQITDLIRLGVSEHYVGGKNGVEELAGLMMLYLKDEIGTTANLNLVLPYKGIDKNYNSVQKEHFNWIKHRANTITILRDGYTKECYRERNQYLVDKSDILIAVCLKGSIHSDVKMAVNMAKQKGIEVRIIDPITLEIEVIQAIKKNYP